MKNVFLIIATVSVLTFLATLVTVLDSNEKITKAQFQYLLLSSLSFITVRYINKKYKTYSANLEEKNKDLERKRKDEQDKFEKIENAKRVLNTYLEFIQSKPLSFEEIRNESSLPYPKSEILLAFEIIHKEEPILENVIPITFISDLAFYRNDVPKQGYISALIKIKDIGKTSGLETAKIVNEDSFPRDLYNYCILEKVRIEKAFYN